MTKRTLLALGAAAALLFVAAVAIGSAVVSDPDTKPSPSPPPPARAAPPSDTPAGFERFRDDRAGVSIAYPRDWRRLPADDPDVRLLVGDGERQSLLLRDAPVGLRVTRETLPSVRDLTDGLVRSDPSVQLSAPRREIVLGDLPGYRYRYTFAAAGGRRGAHEHVFLFKDDRMITIVVQTLPAGPPARLSALFERVAGTFRGRA